MAEPVDYFMQGVGLGQRSRSIRNQEDQFRTNLAERARQFDLSNDIAQSNLQLRQKEFSLQQENAVIDNRYKTANSIRLEAANQTNKKLADEAVQFAPNLSAYNDELNLWNAAEQPIPKIPSGLPLAQRKEAEAMRDSAIEASKSDEYVKIQKDWIASKKQIWIDDYKWAQQNFPNLITENEFGEPYYDPKEVQNARKLSAQMRAMQFGRTGLPMSGQSVQVELPDGTKRTTTYAPRKPVASAREEFLMKNYSDFVDEDNNFNREAFEAAFKAFTPLKKNEGLIGDEIIKLDELEEPINKPRNPREAGDPTATEINRP